MDLREQILLELILESDLPVSEAAMFVTPKIRRALKDTPVVTKKEFLDEVRPCDILVTFTPKKTLQSTFVQVKAKFMSMFQASPFTSSKLALNRNIIAGYGVDPTTDNYLQTYSLHNFINRWIQEAMLIRVPDVTADQKKKIQQYLRSRMGLTYNSDQVLKSAWKRFYKKILPAFRGKDPDPKLLRQLRDPLFCSNIIAVAYKAAGYRKSFGKSIYDIWPRDFITAPFTEKVCRIEYK